MKQLGEIVTNINVDRSRRRERPKKKMEWVHGINDSTKAAFLHCVRGDVGKHV